MIRWESFMKRLLAAIFLAVPLLAQGPIQWEHDLASAQKRAKAEKKAIFVDVWTEWCGWCIKLQKDVFTTPEAQRALRTVVPLSLKTQLKDGTPTDQKPMEEKFGVEGFPALLIIDADGKVIRRQPGYVPTAQFVQFVEGK
jgi:thioredoxin-related protein